MASNDPAPIASKISEPDTKAPSAPTGDPAVAATTTEASRADAPAPLARPKRIAIFSDGTGNSSGKLFRTNVYRLYDALDLGSAAASGTQIAYYDNGVGTSAVRFMALLGGIFGIGLKSNLLELYEYVCRNYNHSYPDHVGGDKIYAFGFSRGAFTIRLLTALICTQGVVPYEDERELKRNCGDALRRFLGANAPDHFPWLFKSARWLRDRLIQAGRVLRGLPFDVKAAVFPEIEFVGVWDTVAAYGGPFVELTRGIDQYVWPLTMTDYSLHPLVKEARHALALDDERDTFWPLLWDEIAEEHAQLGKSRFAWTTEQRARAVTRLKQVWFAGMHSDVGGGYPDDSLGYVSLKWMLDELAALPEASRLSFIQTEVQRIRAFANPLGPMHDSRSGLGGYYRYQPRKIAALLHRSVADTVSMDQTRVLRDPTIGEKDYRPQGLLCSCRVHRSVLERIGLGNDNYAPIVLPREFAIEPPFPVGATDPLAEAARNIAEPERARARGEIQENAWDFVWKRRICYFVVVGLTLALFTAPMWPGDGGITPDTDARYPLAAIFEWVRDVVPGFATPWYDALTRHWRTTLLLLAAIGLITRMMTSLEANLRDRVRIAWWGAVDGNTLEKVEPTAWRVLRNSPTYQSVLQFWKWRLLPVVFGLGLLLAVPYVGFALWTQVALFGMERDNQFCTDEKEEAVVQATPVVVASAPLAFKAENPCATFLPMAHEALPQTARAGVIAGQRYYVVIDLPRSGSPWRDGRHPVGVAGKRSLSFPFPSNLLMSAAVPLRRVISANWLEPVIEIRDAEPVLGLSGYRRDVKLLRLSPLDRPLLHIKGRNGKSDDREILRFPQRWIGFFEAPIDGSVHVFLNDAGLPVGFGQPAYFYGSEAGRNQGIATIRVWDAEKLEQRSVACGANKWNARVMASKLACFEATADPPARTAPPNNSGAKVAPAPRSSNVSEEKASPVELIQFSAIR